LEATPEETTREDPPTSGSGRMTTTTAKGGPLTSDDLLGEIFSRFCIGK
jgi:hypothetical protein